MRTDISSEVRRSSKDNKYDGAYTAHTDKVSPSHSSGTAAKQGGYIPPADSKIDKACTKHIFKHIFKQLNYIERPEERWARATREEFKQLVSRDTWQLPQNCSTPMISYDIRDAYIFPTLSTTLTPCVWAFKYKDPCDEYIHVPLSTTTQ